MLYYDFLPQEPGKEKREQRGPCKMNDFGRPDQANQLGKTGGANDREWHRAIVHFP
jgi:hypothetical protein